MVELGDFLVEEGNDGGVLKEPVAIFFGSLDVAGFVGAVAGFAVVEDAFWGDGAG